jgi:hypothetical protein
LGQAKNFKFLECQLITLIKKPLQSWCPSPNHQLGPVNFKREINYFQIFIRLRVDVVVTAEGIWIGWWLPKF